MTVSKWERGVLDPNLYQASLLEACIMASVRAPLTVPKIRKLLKTDGALRALFLLLSLFYTGRDVLPCIAPDPEIDKDAEGSA